MSRTLVLISLLVLASVAAVSARRQERRRALPTGYDSWRSRAARLDDSRHRRAADGSLTPRRARPQTDHGPGRRLPRRQLLQRRRYLVGEAISPGPPRRSAFTEAIASWNAETPAGTWIETGSGRMSPAAGRSGTASAPGPPARRTRSRHSVQAPGRQPTDSRVDTLVLNGKKAPPADAYQVKLRLFSADGTAFRASRFLSVASSTAAPEPADARAGDSGSREHARRRAPALPDGLPRRRQRLVQPDVGLDGAGALDGATAGGRSRGSARRSRASSTGATTATATGPSTPPGPRTRGWRLGRPVHLDPGCRGLGGGGRAGGLQLGLEEGRGHGQRGSSSDGHLAVIVGFDATGIRSSRPRGGGERGCPADVRPGRAETVWLRRPAAPST